MNDLLRRKAAMDATLAKFSGKPLDWKRYDCVRMGRFHLSQMGYAPPALPRYANPIGAKRALMRAGGLVTVLDGILERITPAQAMLGDIALIEGDGMESLVLSAGYKFIGWHEQSEVLSPMTVLEFVGVWRV